MHRKLIDDPPLDDDERKSGHQDHNQERGPHVRLPGMKQRIEDPV